ncbi:MAG: hypothetical protein AMXMBFR7_22530 [Planctomycetota bacterium]
MEIAPNGMSTATQPPTPGFSFQQAILDLERLTGFGVSFHNHGQMPRISWQEQPAKRGQHEGSRNHLSDYCETMKSTPAGTAACLACDSTRAHEKAGNAGRPCIWRCHAGLTEVLIPVSADGRHYGTLFAGQARTPDLSERELERLRKRWAKLGHDPRRIERLMNALPLAEPERMQALARTAGMLAEYAASRARAQTIARAQAAEKRTPVDRALSLMLEHLAEPLSLEEIAERVHLSPSRLSHLFTQQEGESFRDRLLQMRIELAKELLSTTPLPVGEVARRVGYADPNFFSRIFHEKTGLAPREHRRRYAQA